MRTHLALTLAMPAVLALGAPGQAEPVSMTTDATLCTGCTLALPEDQSDMPLVVVLPDAGEQPAHAAERYRADALARGWAVLAVPCPSESGCEGGSWSTWQGPARYVTQSVAAIERDHLVDTSRVYLAGRGEGATFAATNATAWRGTFAAMVIEDGGTAPRPRAQCPSRSLPTYFIGDTTSADAIRFRTYYARCEQELRFEPSANVTTSQLLDWMNQHARPVFVSAL